MPARVELTNNSYTQRLQVLINGNPVSDYSSIKKYMDEPFQYWCDKILSEIYEECNRSPFMLHFSSRQEERHVMEVLAGEYPHCMQYSSSSTQRPDSLQKRMTELSRSLKENPNVRVKKLSRSVLFVIPESLRSLENELLSMEVVNSFCNIESCVTYYQEYYRAHDSSDFLFLISASGCTCSTIYT